NYGAKLQIVRNGQIHPWSEAPVVIPDSPVSLARHATGMPQTLVTRPAELRGQAANCTQWANPSPGRAPVLLPARGLNRNVTKKFRRALWQMIAVSSRVLNGSIATSLSVHCHVRSALLD